MTKNMISLRNLLLVAFLFHDANLLNIEKDPTQELAQRVHAIRQADTERCLIFIILINLRMNNEINLHIKRSLLDCFCFFLTEQAGWISIFNIYEQMATVVSYESMCHL